MHRLERVLWVHPRSQPIDQSGRPTEAVSFLELLGIGSKFLLVHAIDVVFEPLVAWEGRGVVLEQAPARRELAGLAHIDLIKVEEVVKAEVWARVF